MQINKTLNVGIIGASQYGHTHYRTLSTMPDVRIKAACDINPVSLSSTCDTFGIKEGHTDYHDLLADATLDAVYVIVRPRLMFPIAMDVIRAGKHIFTEKPLGNSLAEATALADAASAAGVKNAVGCNRRYCAVVRKAKQVVEAEGLVSGVLAEYHKDCHEPIYDTNILTADGVHALDAMRYLGGDVASVHAHADRWYRSAGWEGKNNVFHALVRFESGASGVFVANRQNGGRREYFEIHGRDISAYVYTPGRAEIYRSGVAAPEIIYGKDLVGSDDPLMTYGYYDESVDFFNAIRQGGTSQTSFADNVKTMTLVEAVDAGDHIDRT